MEEKEKEEWRAVVGYEGLYEVSSFGRVKSLSRNIKRKGGYLSFRKERILKPCSRCGYMLVVLCNYNERKTVSVHKIVSIAFLSHIPKEDGLVVDHINGIRHDNRLINLHLVTIRENNSICFRKNSDKFTSKFAGVSWCKSKKKWVAHIRLNRIVKSLGRFNSELDASKAYQDALSICYSKLSTSNNTVLPNIKT